MKNNIVADKLYNLLGTKFNNTEIKTLDSKGKETTDMEEIEMFSFDFLVDSRNYGPVVILLSAEDNLEVYYGDNTSKSLDRDAKRKWENLIEHLSTFARSNRLGFSLNHITDLKYDLSNIANITESYRNIFEGYYGTRKTSYSPQGKAKIIIKHSKAIGEDDKRYRNISQIFIENADGERFKLPFKKLTGARAMARHVTEGGNPYDLFGIHICEMVKDINTLGGFVRRSKMYEGNDEAMAMVENGRTHYNTMRKGLKTIAGKRGYHTYKKSWEPSEITEQDTDTSAIRKLFTQATVNQRTEDAIPLLARLQQMAEDIQLNELKMSERKYKGFTVEINPYKKGFAARARNRGGNVIATAPGKTEEEAYKAVIPKIEELVSTQKKVTGRATLDFNADFTQHLLKAGEDEIWAKVEAGPKLIIADGEMYDMGPDILKGYGFTRSARRNPNAAEGSTAMLAVPLTAKQAKDAGVVANGRYVIDDVSKDADGNRVYELHYDSTVAASGEKFRMGVPAVTVGTLREATVESEIEWPDEAKSDEFPGDTHPDQDDDVMPMDEGNYEDQVRQRNRLAGKPGGRSAWPIDNKPKKKSNKKGKEMGEINEFEQWADKIVEGTWAVPETPEQIEELQAFLSKPQPLGIDAINVTNTLYNLVGADDLFDELSNIASDDPEADARPAVINWIENAINVGGFTNPHVPRHLQRILNSLNIEEGFDTDLDADDETQLNASVNKDMDAYKRNNENEDKNMKPYSESESEAGPVVDADKDEKKEWGKADKEEISESADFDALKERTKFLLTK